MKTVRRLGNVSLAVAVGGFAAVETALRLKLVNGPVWQIVGQAFEAATVGSIADWFAVTALFHEVPLPVIRRHTNIVVNNRDRIVKGIANMVQNRWLSRDEILGYVAGFSASGQLLDRLSDETQAASVLSFLRDLLGKVVRGIDEPEVSAFLDRTLKDQLADLDLAAPLGRWIGAAIRRGDHQAVWETVLSALEEATHGEELRTALGNGIARAIQEYREQSFLKGVVVQVAEILKMITRDEAVDILLRKIEQGVQEARGNPTHPLRERLDVVLLEFADGLAAGRAESVGSLEKLHRAFVEAADTREYIAKALSRLRETVDSELSKPGSELDRLIRRIFQEQLESFRKDVATQAKLDTWVRNVANELVEERHAEIGLMVRRSLEKLSDLDLVSQIEEQVGTDLQYIRLNGAIVGGLVGTVLAVGKWLL